MKRSINSMSPLAAALGQHPLCAPFVVLASTLSRRLVRSERGQATVEYGLVLLGAIAITVALFAFLKDNAHLEKMLDGVFKKVGDDLDVSKQ